MSIKEAFDRKYGKKYDLDTLEGINSIPIKSFDYDPQDGKEYAFSKIEYILQRKATEHKRNGRLDLAIACLRKSNEIMPLSEMEYSVDDYLRLAKYLRLDKQFEEAKKVEERYLDKKSDFSSESQQSKVNDIQIKNASKLGTDLVEAQCSSYHCANCSAYGNRVYSLSGNDSRFPKIPAYIHDNASHCGITLYPFIFGCSIITNPYTNKRVDDVIKYSNRPYEDSRPKEWIEGYENLLKLNKQREIDSANSKQASLEYEQIVLKLPDIAPKSQSGYLRMKKGNSSNYQKLAEKARSAGIEIKDIIT